ncbi:MAG: carbohydrate kinase family protein [Anaerolineae bacterium]|nr:carbohydrate kinase family protein [Anaerolineae bacterium]
MNMSKVIVLGDIILDMIAHIPRYPQPGGDGIARSVLIKSGGSAANTARALARCGIATSLISRTGNDVFAQQALAELDRVGVDMSLIQRDQDTSSGLMFITVTPDGQRTMFGYRGANARTYANELDEDAIRGTLWLHVSGYALLQEPQREAALCALAIARSAGIKISLDPGLEIVLCDAELLDSLLPEIDVLMPNEDELLALSGADDNIERSMHKLGGRGIPIIALKLGANGCMLYERGDVVHVPAFSVPAVDTTGAGDAFAAGFIAGQTLGLDLRACGVWANAMGALAASVEGSYAPAQDELAAFMQHHALSPKWTGWEKTFRHIADALEKGGR